MKERLKERRKILRLTLQEVADLVGTSKSYVWELENRDNLEPSARKLDAFAQALETTSRYLIYGVVGDRHILERYELMSDKNKKLLDMIAKEILKTQGN